MRESPDGVDLFAFAALVVVTLVVVTLTLLNYFHVFGFMTTDVVRWRLIGTSIILASVVLVRIALWRKAA